MGGCQGESRPGGRVRTEAAYRRAWEKQAAFRHICRAWGEQWGRGRARWHFATWGLACSLEQVGGCKALWPEPECYQLPLDLEWMSLTSGH